MAEWLKRSRSFAAETDQVAVMEALGLLGADARSQADLLRPMLQGDRWNARRRVAAALALFRISGNKTSCFRPARGVAGAEEIVHLLLGPTCRITTGACGDERWVFLPRKETSEPNR